MGNELVKDKVKHEWRKHEKDIYLPKNKPTRVIIPTLKYFTIEGEGNPGGDEFAEYIGVLYSLAYGVKMSPKKGLVPEGYFEYTVYPLEGVWDVNDEAKHRYHNGTHDGTLNKDELVFKLMIRQPDFIDKDFAQKIIDLTKEKKPHPLLDRVKFEQIEEGLCIQMLHFGSYDDEPASFKLLEDFAESSGLVRKSKVHREIYLSDARKVAPEKLKTVLRCKVRKL